MVALSYFNFGFANCLLTCLLVEQLSGARVTLVEDSPEVTQKIIQISGAPEQTERAQSLLQGFILSSKSFFLCLQVLVACAYWYCVVRLWFHTIQF